MEPRIQYAQAKDGVSIAFWTLGEGEPFIYMPAQFSHIQLEWQHIEYRRWFERLAEKRMVVRYDGRGTGLSERDVTDYSLDARLLDSGRFSWGVVQHEFAHQVDFLLLTQDNRVEVQRLLGAKAWCWETSGFAHAEYGCERFASTLAWTYWQNGDNCMKPASKSDESAGMAPAAFRATVARLLNVPSLRKRSTS